MEKTDKELQTFAKEVIYRIVGDIEWSTVCEVHEIVHGSELSEEDSAKVHNMIMDASLDITFN